MTKIEVERLASLVNHPGFKALLSILDEADALLLEKLEKPDPDMELANLNLWRASRRFRRLIEHQPEACLEALGGNPLSDLIA